MFAKCSNSDCGAPFDYREGQLVRSCKSPSAGQSPADQCRVEHFWLCGSCSKLYVLEYKLGEDMQIKLRINQLRESVAVSFIKAA